ncbi:unnamed protein product, partial [Leptidea sinapis]
DTLYRLSLRGLRPLERADWPAPADKTKLCQDKGQTDDDCHNYIKVLLAYGHKLFTCGTNAFSPLCTWREWVPGVANCPHNPHSNVTAVLSSTGEYYAGTPTDFTSSDTAIYRSRGASPYDPGMLRTTQYDFNWLNEPQFVGSFEDDLFVYFVFREVAVEFLNCGNIIYSRIARVCKNDPGGNLVMKKNWSTFLKARLNCSVPGDVPFNYDEIQSMEYLPQEKILVAVFTTPTNSIAGSAVCIYNMSDIQAAFDGPYKVKDSPTSTWEPRSPSPQAREHFRCVNNTREHQAMEYHTYHLMYDSVQPISGEPVYRATLERFTHVTVDVANAKNVGKQLVAFVATEKSTIMKLAILPRFEGACLVEIWKLKDEGDIFDIQKIQFSRSSCVGATDPHCGWDDARELCLKAATHLHQSYFVQSTAACPTLKTPVDGGWSSWSDWEECMQDGTPRDSFTDDKPDMCMCHPALAAVDGGWSSWSAWSTCTSSSATCGANAGVRERRRTCNDPAPKYGGADCDGARSERQPCDLRPCDVRKATAWTPWVQTLGNSSDGSYTEKRFKFLCKAPTPEQIKLSLAREEERYCTALGSCSSSIPEDEGGWETWGPWGEWSCWSDWSECAGGGCGAGASGTGHRTRTRMCLSPEGCADAGAALERRVCVNTCPELYAMPAYSESIEMASFVTSGGQLSSLPCSGNSNVTSRGNVVQQTDWSPLQSPLHDKTEQLRHSPVEGSRIGGGSGIILSKSNNISNANNHSTSMATPKLYPKAIANEYDTMGTMRRHSNQPNNKTNLDLEEDKFY